MYNVELLGFVNKNTKEIEEVLQELSDLNLGIVKNKLAKLLLTNYSMIDMLKVEVPDEPVKYDATGGLLDEV